MSDPVQQALLRSAAVLACKYLILKTCDGLSIGLAALTKELAEESGPFARESDSLAIAFENLRDQIQTIVYGKSRIHSVLYGDQDDRRLIETVSAILERLQQDLINPLRSFIREIDDEKEVRARVRALSSRSAALHAQVQQILIEAKTRFVSADLQHTKAFVENWLKPEDPIEEEWSIVSVDKAAYSTGALALESLASPRALMEHNRDILKLFITAIESAGGDPSEILVHASGDGALLYIKDPNIAVQAGLHVHEAARRKTRNLPTPKWAQQFRIGIATGPVCIARERTMDGKTIRFDSGGVTIINAVRIESECDPGQLLICYTTVKRLKRLDLQDRFGPPQAIPTKSHEERELLVCKYLA